MPSSFADMTSIIDNVNQENAYWFDDFSLSVDQNKVCYELHLYISFASFANEDLQVCEVWPQHHHLVEHVE